MPGYSIFFCTATALLVGLWRLPSRMSIVRYGIGGAAIGVVGSYVHWKYQMIGYYDTLNRLMRVVTLEKY